MYNKAMAAGAYHYAAASRLIKAYGFMVMTDIFGEMPYTQAFQDYNSPKFDTGKTIFMGCLADIDEAIELFQKHNRRQRSHWLPATAGTTVMPRNG